MPYHTGIRLLCVAQNPANGFPARLLVPSPVAQFNVILSAQLIFIGGVETRAFGSFIRVCCIPGLVASIRLLVEESRLILIHHDVAGWLALGVGWLGKLLLREQVSGKYLGQQLRSFGLKVEGCLDHPQ